MLPYVTEKQAKRIAEENKVTSLSASSTDDQCPSAKCVYDELAKKANSYDVENIENIPQSILQKLKVGDIVSNQSFGSGGFIVTSNDQVDLYLTRLDEIYVTVVVYTKSDDEWGFVSRTDYSIPTSAGTKLYKHDIYINKLNNYYSGPSIHLIILSNKQTAFSLSDTDDKNQILGLLYGRYMKFIKNYGTTSRSGYVYDIAYDIATAKYSISLNALLDTDVSGSEECNYTDTVTEL